MELSRSASRNIPKPMSRTPPAPSSRWTVKDGAFQENAAGHDPGEKIILGKKGALNGSGLVKMLLDHPATSSGWPGKLVRLIFRAKRALPRRRESAGCRTAPRFAEHRLAVENHSAVEGLFDDSKHGTKILDRSIT